MSAALIKKKQPKENDVPLVNTVPPKDNHSIKEFLVRKPKPSSNGSSSHSVARPSPNKRHKSSSPQKSAPPNGIAPPSSSPKPSGSAASHPNEKASGVSEAAPSSPAKVNPVRSPSMSSMSSHTTSSSQSDDSGDDDAEPEYDKEASDLAKAVKSVRVTTTNPMHFSVMVYQQLLNIRYSDVRGKSTMDLIVKYFNTKEVYPRRYHRIKVTTTINNARKTCLEEQAWLTMASGYDVMDFDMKLKWPMYAGQKVEDQILVKDYVLTFDSISSWLNPRTFWKMDMPRPVMEMLEWRTAHHFLQFQGVDDKLKKRGNAVESSEHVRIGEINYDILTLACDAFWWHRRKRVMAKKWPIAPRDKYAGYDNDTARLSTFLNDQMKKRVEGTVEQKGRRMVLESNMPLGSTDRFCRMNPQVLDYYTPEDVFLTSLDEKDYATADDQRACKIYISESERKIRLTTRAKYIAEWEEAKQQYVKHNRELIAEAKKKGLPFHLPDSFKSKDGSIVGQKDIDRLTVEMTPETRDIWHLAMFDAWWKRETTQNFCDTHCVMWADWDHPDELRSALKRLSLEFEDDGKTPRRPLITCLGLGIWYVHYKGMFLIPDETTIDPLKLTHKHNQPPTPTRTRPIIACLALWMSITKDDYKNKLGPGLVAPEKPTFWQPTQDEKNAADKENAKTFRYRAPADAVTDFLSKRAK